MTRFRDGATAGDDWVETDEVGVVLPNGVRNDQTRSLIVLQVIIGLCETSKHSNRASVHFRMSRSGTLFRYASPYSFLSFVFALIRRIADMTSTSGQSSKSASAHRMLPSRFQAAVLRRWQEGGQSGLASSVAGSLLKG